MRPAAGPGEAASAHVARESAGQDGPGRPPPAWKATRARGADWGAFLNTRLEEVLPTRTDYLGATAIGEQRLDTKRCRHWQYQDQRGVERHDPGREPAL